ncbi:MAG: NAD-dependent epimerase/dehydratase family protein [Pseudomonadota bacterium]
MSAITTNHVSDAVHRIGTAAVSGATGFIGRNLVKALCHRGVSLIALVRDPARARELLADELIMSRTVDFGLDGGIGYSCEGADTVFHLAGYAHAEDADSDAAASLHWRVTVEGTAALLREAIRAGVQRFVFASSVKAMGEGAVNCLDENLPATPISHYGRAKLEAERLVLAAGRQSGMHTAILRLPLVYGPGNRGNIPRMIASISRGWFPSLPEVGNKRSMVHVDDVVQALILAAEKPEANGQVYIVTDGHIYSTRDIYMAICGELGRKSPSWSTPLWALRLLARAGDILGKISRCRAPLDSAVLNKLFGSAWYSSDKIRRELGYAPRHSLYDALGEMTAEFRANS